MQRWQETAISAMVLLLPIFLIWAVLQFLCKYWWRPRIMKNVLQMQQICGPPPSFMVGNMVEMVNLRTVALEQDMKVGDHSILKRIYPHYTKWQAEYGNKFVFWCGLEPRITLVELELIKEVLSTKAPYFGKSGLQQKGGFLLLGNGLVLANGENWAQRRRIVAPAFHIEKLKGMASVMVESTSKMLDNWEAILDSSKGSAEIDVNYHLSVVTSDIICRTAFGSGHNEGRMVLQHLHSLQKVFALSNRYLWMPCSSFLPTAANKETSRLRKEIERLLKNLIQEKRAVVESRPGSSHGSDLLGLMLAEADREVQHGKKALLGISELVEECKTFFFTGQETTSVLLTWTLMLLSLNPEWQDKGRAEVQELCNNTCPDTETLSRMKTLGMILNEALRLYPPAPALVREAFKDMQLGGMTIPKGSTFWIPILAIHHDQELWGPNAHEFRPERFCQGIAKACKHPLEFMPFSFGPRVCVGQNFAIMEAKIILALILQKFKFTLSPNYRHAPVTAITLDQRLIGFRRSAEFPIRSPPSGLLRNKECRLFSI